MTAGIVLRDVLDDDLEIFFRHQNDEEAGFMAAFTRKDPSDREAFLEHWTKVRGDGEVRVRTILLDGSVAGHVVSHDWLGSPEISYWIGKEHWGKGVATVALTMFLEQVDRRPLLARVVKDNIASIRVLEKCGFTVCGEERNFANARGEEVEELLMKVGGRIEL